MGNWRKHTVLGLMVCVFYLPLADASLAGTETGPPDSNLTKLRVVQLGVGTKVKLKLADGKKLKGSIQSIDELGFDVASERTGSRARLGYDQVTHLRAAKITYNAKG